MTRRDDVEQVLLNIFSQELRSVDPACADIIHGFKNGVFGRSYLGFQLYANGHNTLSTSTHNPRGLLYYDGRSLFAVGVFFRPEEQDVPCIHIIAPEGKNWCDAVEWFVTNAQLHLPDARFFARQLTFEQYKKMKVQPNLERILKMHPQSRWTAIEHDPWLPAAPQEDETFQDSIIHLETILRDPEKGAFNNIPNLSANSRDMARRNYNGFKNFLERNNLEYKLVTYDAGLQDTARQLVTEHFKRLEADGKAIGSTAADYENIISTIPQDFPNSGLHMWIGYVQPNGNGKDRRAVSFFGFEELQKPGEAKCCGGYATITTYDPSVLKGLVQDEIGFRNIATYASATVLHALKERGMRYVKLGGSETRDLNNGKKKQGAMPDNTSWAASLQNPGKPAATR